MFLSRLILHANHPQAKSELEHPYELHRTLCNYFVSPDEARILFRADADRTGEINVIVQSLVAPDWLRKDFEPRYLKCKDEPKEITLGALSVGQTLKFRLRCRPTKRIAEKGHPDEGKRKSLRTKEEIFAWLERKADENGFALVEAAFDRVYWNESKGGKDAKPLGAVQFDGVITVTDPDKLREAVANGIGTQKAYGFGLLSLARLCE
jgi:CRISPR system Cascade subunit CasE